MLTIERLYLFDDVPLDPSLPEEALMETADYAYELIQGLPIQVLIKSRYPSLDTNKDTSTIKEVIRVVKESGQCKQIVKCDYTHAYLI